MPIVDPASRPIPVPLTHDAHDRLGAEAGDRRLIGRPHRCGAGGAAHRNGRPAAAPEPGRSDRKAIVGALPDPFAIARLCVDFAAKKYYLRIIYTNAE